MGGGELMLLQQETGVCGADILVEGDLGSGDELGKYSGGELG